MTTPSPASDPPAATAIASPFAPALIAHATVIIERAKSLNLKIATAESCTGGLVAGLLTDIPGSSAVVDRGFVTYSNEAKSEMLRVPAELISELGAVSGEVALAMALGALDASRADITVAITGIAGPGGGSDAKPVGLVHFAAARTGCPTLAVERRFGDLGRAGIRHKSIEQALDLIEAMLTI
jgi:nicotinamide-nucleotide amidase